jgi:hypothetical protein
VTRFRCGRCQGVLLKLGRFNVDGTPAKERVASGFALYVKSTYSTTKAQNPTTPHRDIMKVIAANYQSTKKATTEAATGVPSKSITAEQLELERQMTSLSFDDAVSSS